MKMKKIKFRGKRLDNGEFIYGDLLHHGKFGVCIREYIIDGFSTLPVEPESVAQLVGYDCNGNEIYEGDKLIDNEGNEYIASLDANLYSTKDATSRAWQPYVGDICKTSLKLKGMSGNEEN